VAVRAAAWAKAFYPDIAIETAGRVARLTSAGRRAEELRMIWQTSLANEVMLADAAPGRAALIEALVR